MKCNETFVYLIIINIQMKKKQGFPFHYPKSSARSCWNSLLDNVSSSYQQYPPPPPRVDSLPSLPWWLSCSVASDSCDPVDCGSQGSSVQGILQARILEGVAISFSRGSFQPRDQTQVSCTAESLPTELPVKPAFSLNTC